MASPNTSGATNRITKEIANLQKNEDLSLAVGYEESDVRNVRALIIGPPETPYEYGMFEFEVKFGKEYPIKSPNVRCITTNGGRCRFNPNIYAEGKVCLSILGTWRGNPGEEWSSAQGLESVLLSIQSLMSSNPYENEPGYETAKKDESNPKAYVEKIRHETLRISVIQRLENLLGFPPEHSAGPHVSKRPRLNGTLSPGNSPANANGKSPAHANSTSNASTPATESSVYEYDAEATYNDDVLDDVEWDPFADLMKRRFLWYYDSYIRAVEEASKEHGSNEAFKRMEFEYPPNSMEGNFDYKSLRKRLERVKQALDDEREDWKMMGAIQVNDGTQLATQLAFQFKQLTHLWSQQSHDGSRLEISLPEKDNPFVWSLTLFGKPMTNLDGGMWNMKLWIPPNFPDTQPRVGFETPIFHHRVSSTGTLCYFPKKEDEIGSHLEAIVAAIDDQDPRYDPRAVVNPDAFALYWGGDNKRKQYNRKLRRSAQESCEFDR